MSSTKTSQWCAELATQLESGDDPLRIPYLELQISRADLALLLARLLGETVPLHIGEELALWTEGGSPRLGPPPGNQGLSAQLDDETLWELFGGPEAPSIARLAALALLVGAKREAHGLVLDPAPEGRAVELASRIALPPALLRELAAALLPGSGSLLLGLVESGRCWTIVVGPDRLGFDTRAADVELRALARAARIEHDVDLALMATPDGRWRLSTRLELDDLLELLSRLPVRQGLANLLAAYREHAARVLAERTVAIEVEGLENHATPLLLELAGGVLRLQQERATQGAEPPLRVPLGAVRRGLDLLLFSGGERLAELLDRLIPAGLRTDRQEEQVLLAGRLIDEQGRPHELLVCGGRHHPGGVLWEGESLLVVTGPDGAPRHTVEGLREPLAIFAQGDRLTLACPEEFELPLLMRPATSFNWGPGTLLSESNVLSPLLPGLRGFVRLARLAAPLQCTLGGRRYRLTSAQAQLVTLAGVRYRGLLDLAETRLHAALWDGAATTWIARADCLPQGPRPHWWKELVRATGEACRIAVDPPGAAPLLATPDARLPDDARWQVLQAIATPFDSRGVFTVRLRAHLVHAKGQGLVATEQTVDLRQLLPEPVWDDQVLRLFPRWTAQGLQLDYGDKTLLELALRRNLAPAENV